uniref:Uncharacterized protein n=1 Tax=Arundo donax TaxID=35708 RepID=A0A0A9FQQ2_ARUDO
MLLSRYSPFPSLVNRSVLMVMCCPLSELGVPTEHWHRSFDSVTFERKSHS